MRTEDDVVGEDMKYFELVHIIQERIKEKKMTKQKMIRELDISQTTFYSWMAMRTIIPTDYMLTMLHILDLDLELVFTGENSTIEM